MKNFLLTDFLQAFVLLNYGTLISNSFPMPDSSAHGVYRLETSDSASGEQMDRGIGFKKMKPVNDTGTTEKSFPFGESDPNWKSKPGERMLEIAKVHDDIDPEDADYYATYSFEFAKSGHRTPNFSKKLRKYENQKLEANKQQSPSPQNNIAAEPEKPKPEPDKPKSEPEKPKSEPEKPKSEPEKPKPVPVKKPKGDGYGQSGESDSLVTGLLR